MALRALDIQGYRSLRRLHLPLDRLNVITGPNGSGKSNLYRSLWLISQICEGDFARSICREGGLLSVMWAGARTDAKKPVRMLLGFQTDELTFQLTCGFPPPAGGFPPGASTVFRYDPQIKEEFVWHGAVRKPSTMLLDRGLGITWIRDLEGRRVEYPLVLGENESILSQLREPHRFPELFAIREEVRGWRFYHTFRTDDDSPLRIPQVSVRTPVLSHDGSDLAAALQTILEIGDRERLEAAINSALPGRALVILCNNDVSNTQLTVGLTTEGCARPLVSRELSDGTLRFLCLAASLLSPRPPALIAINEPESSLHPDLLPALAELIVNAAEYSQIWISTHSAILADNIQTLSGVQPIRLKLVNGETAIAAEPED